MRDLRNCGYFIFPGKGKAGSSLDFLPRSAAVH